MSAALTITMPLTEADIPAALEALRKEQAVVQARARIVRAAIENVQKMCSHPRKVEWVDQGGTGHSRCEVCGKEDCQ